MNEYEILVKSDAIYLDANVLFKIDRDEGDSSRLVRILVYGTDLKIFSSWVAFGEIIGILNKKKIQNEIGLSNYLHYARSLIKDL